MISLSIPQIATSIYTVLDKTMLGILIDDISEVGFYEQSQKIIKVALTFVTTMSIVMMPRISNTYAQGDNKKIKSYMNKSFRFNWFLGIPIMFGIIGTAEKLVPWFFGQGYAKVTLLMKFTSPVIIFIAFSTTIGSQFLISIKKQNIHTISVLSGAISNVVLNFILIPKFESVGAVIATVFAEFLIVVIEITYITKKNYTRLSDIFCHITKYLISGIFMYIIVKILANNMDVSILNTMIQVIVGGITYCLGLTILKDDFFINIVNRILKRGDLT